jgi:hypothetical protein
MSEFLEIKRHINKPDERYRCELLRKEPGRIILRYVSDRAFASSRLGITFPPGCVTLALYRTSRPYVFWAIYSPSAELLGYLIHICKDMEISESSLSYLDMLLDIWFYPDGRRIVLDEDEVEQCLREGLITKAEADYIEAGKEAAVKEFPVNAEEAAALADTLDISGESP